MDMHSTKIIATGCSGCQNCPVAEFDETRQIVKISDPEKPERGSFEMTAEEWNRIVDTAKHI